MTVTPHPSLPGLYETNGWSFSIDPVEDGDLAYVDQAIAAWTEWKEFLLHRQDEQQQQTLF